MGDSKENPVASEMEFRTEETRMPHGRNNGSGSRIIYHLHSNNPEEAQRQYQQLLMNREERRLGREKRDEDMKAREEEIRRIDEKMEKERQEKRRRREEEVKKEAERRAKEEKERMEEEERNKAERRLEEEEAKANKKRKEEMERREEEIDRREREMKRREEELEKKEKQTEKRLKEKEEEGILKAEREWKEKEEKRLKEAKEEEERREKEYRKKKEDLRKREEKMREEGMAEIQNVKDKLEEERANLEKETEGLEKDKEYWEQTVRRAIEDGLRKERMIVEEEVRTNVEGELNGKWRKRVEEVDSWWKTQNSELKGEWENEKMEWEREKAKNVKEMEELRWKLVEVESLSMQLEEKNRRLKSDAELQREEWKRETEKNRRDWMEEKNNMTRKWEGKLKKDVDEAKKAVRMEMEVKMNILAENSKRDINKLKENLEMKEKGLYDLQRTLDTTCSNYEKDIKVLNINYQIELNKIKEQNEDIKKVLSSKKKELDTKEKECSNLLKDFNELQLRTDKKVTRMVEDREREKMQMEKKMINLIEKNERDIKKLKEDIKVKETGLYDLQRKLDATTSNHEKKIEELNNNHKIELNELKYQNEVTKKILNSKINEFDTKENELSILLKELNELQRWTVSEVTRLAEDRRQLYPHLPIHQRHSHSEALGTKVVPLSPSMGNEISSDTCDNWNARQNVVEINEEIIRKLEENWLEYAHRVGERVKDFENKNRKSAGESEGKLMTIARSFLSSITGDASAVVGSVEEHGDANYAMDVNDAFNQNDVKVLSFSNGKGDDSEKYPMQDLSNHGSQLHESKYDPLAGIKCSARAQGEEVKKTDQEVDMNVGCGDLCRDVVKKEVKSANHGKEDLEVAIGRITCESASVSGKKSHVRNDSDSSQDWLVVTERERDDKFNERVTEMNEKHDREIMELRKQIEKHEGEMMKLRKEMEVMRETNCQYQLQSNDQSSEVLTCTEGGVSRKGGEGLGGDE